MTAALKIAPSLKPKAEIKTVTPRMAKEWLKRNVRNRKLRQPLVNAYARDMASGRWQLTGEAIKFDTNEALSDGQHRLSAIIQANASVDMLVVRGVDPDSQTVMDSGAKRTASDALTLVGQKNPAVLAAAARFALREPACGLTVGRERIANPTNSEIAAFIADETPGIQHAAEIAQHYYPAFDAPPSVLAVCWMRFSDIDLEAAAQFFSSIANATSGVGDPRSALIRRLANARRGNERLSQTVYLSMIFRAWNAWRTDTPLGKLQTETRGEAIKVPAVLR